MTPPNGQRGEDSDWLDALLRGQQDGYIEDAGFTQRVVDALPQPFAPSRLRSVILLAATALACLTSLLVLPGGEYLARMLLAVFSEPNRAGPALLLTTAVLLVMIVWGAAAAARAD